VLRRRDADHGLPARAAARQARRHRQGSDHRGRARQGQRRRHEARWRQGHRQLSLACARHGRASRRQMTAIRLAAAALALFASTAVLADDADKDKPINFSSDTGGYSKSTNGGDLTGNAIITQGTLTLHADRITFKVNEDNSVSAIAYGNPVVFRQRRQGTDEYDEAYA